MAIKCKLFMDASMRDEWLSGLLERILKQATEWVNEQKVKVVSSSHAHVVTSYPDRTLDSPQHTFFHASVVIWYEEKVDSQ